MIMGGAGAAAGLNEAAKAVGGGMEAGAAGVFGLTDSVTSLLAALTELGGTLDLMARNPFLSFTFFERIGRHLQKDIIENARVSKRLTDEQVVSWNKWGSAINWTGSALLSFTSRVAYLQSQMRQASIENSRYFSSLNMPYGEGVNTNIALQRQQALQTLSLNIDAAKAQTQITQLLGRHITSSLVSSQLNLDPIKNRDVIEEAYRTYMKRLTLYSRQYPTANIPEMTKKLFSMFGGHGLTQLGAAGAAMEFARGADLNKYAQDVGPGENLSAIVSLASQYIRTGMAPETAFRSAQSSLHVLGQQKGVAGEPLPLERILRLSQLYPGRAAAEQLFVTKQFLNLKEQDKLSGAEGPLYFMTALQRWSKEQGFQHEAPGTVKEIVSSKLGSVLGQSFDTFIELANLPDFTSNIESATDFIKSFAQLNKSELEALRSSKSGSIEFDKVAKSFETQETSAQNLPSFLTGLFDTATGWVTEKSEKAGVSPLILQSLVALLAITGTARIARRGLRSIGKNIGKGMAAGMKGTNAADIMGGANSVVEGMSGTPDLVDAAIVAPSVFKIAKYALTNPSIALPLAAAAVVVYSLIENSRPVTERDRMLKRSVNPFISPSVDPSGLVQGPSFDETFTRSFGPTMESMKLLNPFDPSRKRRGKSISDIARLSQMNQKSVNVSTAGEDTKTAKEDKEGILHVVFSTSSGDSIGEAMVEKGKEAFININLGAVLNSIG